MNGITFDDHSGLCSSCTTEQLHQMSHGNGLRMDWNTWIGSARTPQGFKQTVGGFLTLRMGIDIPLSTSQAAGVSGNYTLSVDVQVSKPKAMSNQPANHPVGTQLVVMAPNSGFFATSNGSSQMVLNPLNETDVLNATPDRSVSEMEALTCGGGFFDDLAHSAQKHAKMLKPVMDTAKHATTGLVRAGEKTLTNPRVLDAAARLGEKVVEKKLLGKGRGMIGAGKKKTMQHANNLSNLLH